MDKITRYEQTYIKATWVFIITAITYVFLSNLNRFTIEFVIFNAFYFSSISTLNIVKKWFINKGLFRDSVYNIIRITELLLLGLGCIFDNLGDFSNLFFMLLLLVSTLSRGRKTGYCILIVWIAVNIVSNVLALEVFKTLHKEVTFTSLMTVLYLNIVYVLLIILCDRIRNDNIQGENENQNLVVQLGEKYEQLAVAQEEIKFHYEKLKDTNTKLEDTNKKLTSSIAEFYTLQQISQAISSIFDIKELLKYVNDIILGVMGVNYCTIILYDEKKESLRVHTTNIKNQDELNTINKNINCPILIGALNSGKPIIENFVDPEEYVFVEGREVNSLICVPLTTKTRKFGLVLIEHKYFSAFDEENVRLLDIIGQQVGITMENAELYQKMQEMATIDGLTGVYNRLYFQERLHKEFKNARDENYPLSLAIFDIDHFKRFNDTFGHLFGDKVLKTIAEIVGSSLRSTDVFARFGGEEFIILFPRTSQQEACEKVEDLRYRISQASIKDNLVTAYVTVSFGIASFPESVRVENELIRLADDALYEAKKAGRNCVMVAEIKKEGYN